MTRLRRLGRWTAERLKDLLYDPTNSHLDPGRAIGWLSALAVVGAAVWNARLGMPIDLGVTGFPGGLATLLGAAAIYIIHDRRNAARGDK